MRVALCTVSLLPLLWATAAAAVQPLPQGATPDAIKADEKILQDVKVGIDPAALLDYFRKLTHTEPDPKQVAQLIQELGNPTFKKREQAFSDLQGFGGSVLPLLRKATLKSKEDPNGSVERLRRLENLIRRIEEKVNPTVQAASVRLLAAHKPDKAAEVLLAFLPFAVDEYVVQEVCDTLTVLAVRDGKPDPALLLGVTDKVAIRRAAAASALLRAGVKEQLPKLRPLLKDPEPKVRLRVALALIGHKDNDAIPQLVDALAHLSPEELVSAEEVLLRLAGKDAPNVALGIDKETRKQTAEEWAAWWDKAKGGVDLAKIDLEKLPVGFTVVARQTTQRIVNGVLTQGGQIVELDRHKKPRWSFDLSTMPVDVQVLGNHRVLVTEYQGMCVTERDFKGNIKWEKQVPSNPLSARRLPNGNTLVVMRNAVLEYDRAGKEVFNHQRNNSDCYRAAKLPNGDLMVINFQGKVERIDAKTKKVVKEYSIANNLGSLWGSIDVLPNGNLLVGLSLTNKVVEFDQDGAKEMGWRPSAPRLRSSGCRTAIRWSSVQQPALVPSSWTPTASRWIPDSAGEHPNDLRGPPPLVQFCRRVAAVLRPPPSR